MWVSGRRNWFEELREKIETGNKIIWMHCSSAGEFEQGKPLIAALKKEYPSYKILISFFSPSGYVSAKNYKQADYMTHLPLDTKKNAEKIIGLVKPALVIFVKYEFWYHHLSVVAFHHIPILLVSATFRKDQIFFKWYGKFLRQILFFFRHIFVQDETSLELLKANNISYCSISGDTRFDRVKEIALSFRKVSSIKDFISNTPVIVAGSTWEDDEKILAEYISKTPGIKLILAPHEISTAHLTTIKNRFPGSIMYSEHSDQHNDSQVLIIDSVGLLARLYQYATITYVGGGFTKDGIHNILEAGVWGKPVIFGSNYRKYREADDLIKAGGGFSIHNAEELGELAGNFFSDKENLQDAGEKAKSYVEKNTGATQKIIQFIQEKRLLTNP